MTSKPSIAYCCTRLSIFTLALITSSCLVPDDEDAEIEDSVQALLTADFEIGHYIRERVIPRAVLFFTGEGFDDVDYDDDEGKSMLICEL